MCQAKKRRLGGAMHEFNPEELTPRQQQWFPLLTEMGLKFMDIFGVLLGERTFYLKRDYGQMPDEPYPVYSLRVYPYKDGKIKINTYSRRGKMTTWEEVGFSPLITRFFKKRTTRFLQGFLEAGLEAEKQTEEPIIKPKLE